MINDKTYKLLGLFIAAFLLLNFPLIGLFSKEKFVFGIPLLYFYIFAVWSGLIIASRRIVQTPSKRDPT